MLDLSRFLHPLGVFDEVLLRFRDEPLGRVEFRQLQIRRLPRGGVAQHFVTHRDGVVMKSELGVLVDGLVVVVRRLARVLQLDVEIADTVVDGEVRIGLILVVQDVQPDLHGLFRIFGLETLRLLFELL